MYTVYVQFACSGLQVGVAISKNRKANLIAHKHTGGKRVGHLPSPLPPLLQLCEVALFLSHSVVGQRTVLMRSSMCGAPSELALHGRSNVLLLIGLFHVNRSRTLPCVKY